MVETNPVDKIQSELREGMGLPKCQKCGCMKETLESLQGSLDLPPKNWSSRNVTL